MSNAVNLQPYEDVYYAQHGLDDLLEEVDGGQLMLREPVRDTYKSMLDAVPDVLGMAYGAPQLSFIHLKKA